MKKALFFEHVFSLWKQTTLTGHAFIKTVLLDFIEKDERRHAKSLKIGS
jgi:hypothetical protein